MQNAAAYIRVSTDDQTEFSPDAQLNAIKEYAKRNDYIITEVYKDDGISGLKAEKRPGFMQMIGAAKQKAFDAIIVHKMDRFSRSREDSVVYKSLLRKECGVKVISVTENFEDDKFGVILEAMLEAMAEYYSMNLSDEVVKGMTEKAKRGGFQANPAFGYRVQDNVLTVIPEEVEAVRDIFRRFVSGEGYFSIARVLNDQGYRTHRGNLFGNRVIEYIIYNPVYIGKLRWTPTGAVKRNWDNPDTLIIDGSHESIIDIETWEQAQKRARETRAKWKRHARPPREHKNWFSGLVYCSECGRTLVASGGGYFRCYGYNHGNCNYTQSIRDEALGKMIIDGLKGAVLSGAPLKYVGTDNLSNQSESTEIKKRLSAISNRIGKVKEAFYNEIISLDEFKADKHRLETEKKSLENRLIELSNKSASDKSEEVKCGIEGVINALESDGNLKEKHDIVHSVVKNIMYNKANNTLDFIFLHV